MTRRAERRRDVGGAIFADEIGIEYGVYGEFRLRSAYQPIFAPFEGSLKPVAVEALIEPHKVGAAISSSVFFDGVAAKDRLFVETMCRTLHLRNFRNIGVGELDLFFNFHPGVNDHPGRVLSELRLMMGGLEDAELHPGMMVCEITEHAAPNDKVLAAIVHEMRRNGLRIAVDDFGAGHSTEERLKLIEPDIVKIDGPWFALLCRFPAAERLFKSLVSLLHDRGTKILVEGIEQPEQLRVALDGGADLLQGFLLGRPALAGTIFDEEPIDTARLLGRSGLASPLIG
ncbi:diguanylate phosphodiesterase [Mesorhizobium sp. Root157]|uniref:EAL domain-containing protein n=1 Tax=Mesorhizobium sp. Root157 TaxID=1736477 RepID=UPI0006F4A4F8|nr:EAL domain-containing protein [Mesorhizobium sp. Root157]KQZ87153.1 diguanylate phosphodiesterase [Mesorhizobium sp. Root157]